MHIAGFFRITTLRFVKKEHQHGDLYSFHFTPSRPLKHIAGQHGVFFLPGLKGVHIFSLSSAPEEEYITFTTHVRKESKYKQRLARLRKGDKMLFIGPVLDFIFQKDVRKYVFLAQGIGITPFRSLLVHADQAKLDVETTLIHVQNEPHTFQDLTSRLATKAFYPTTPEKFTMLVEATTSTPDVTYYLSGSPRFNRLTKRTLRNLGVERSRIRRDSFWGY